MLGVIIKGTSGCNLDCSYCSLGKKTNVQTAGAQELLDMFRYACRVCRFRKEDHLSFILHGGEPTLVRASDYRQAIDTVKREYGEIRMQFSMQSNGYDINDEMLAFLKAYDVRMGISLDGSEAIHNAQRRSVSGAPTFGRITENIRRLSASGIPTACLMVLTGNAFQEGFDYLRFFETNGIPLKINPLLNYGEACEHPQLFLQAGQYAGYLVRMYQYIIKEDIQVHVSPLDTILGGVLADGKIRSCTFDAMCTQRFLCINYKGDIYPCGKYADMDRFKIGNIRDGNYDILASPVMEKLKDRRSRCRPKKCRACKYGDLCSAGCSAEAYIGQDANGVPLLCRDYYELFDYFHGEGLVLLKEELIKQKTEKQSRLMEAKRRATAGMQTEAKRQETAGSGTGKQEQQTEVKRRETAGSRTGKQEQQTEVKRWETAGSRTGKQEQQTEVKRQEMAGRGI